MPLNKVSPGDDAPDCINVIIEIPSHSDPVKYEVDKTTGALVVDRFMSTSMHYPCNYGYVPRTLSEDGDPVDAMVIAPYPLLSGCVIPCRPVGMLQMEDEQGQDNKLLMVPHNGLSQLYEHVTKTDDLPQTILDGISHFFKHYKDLESDKWVEISGWMGPDAAREEIVSSLARYQEDMA